MGEENPKYLAEEESMLGGDVDLEIGGVLSHGCGGSLQSNNGGGEREREENEKGGERAAYLWGKANGEGFIWMDGDGV